MYSGYLHVLPRALVGAATWAPPEALPTLLLVLTTAVRLALVVVAFPVFAAHASSWRWGLAAAATFVFIPAGQHEVWGNVTNLRWFLVAGTAVSLLGVFSSRPLAVLASAVVVCGALSDPLTLLLLPLVVLRVVTASGVARLPALAYLPAAAVQVLSMRPGDRAPGGGLGSVLEDPDWLVGRLLIHGPLTTQLGVTGSIGVTRLVGLLALAVVLLPLVVLLVGLRSPTGPFDPSFVVVLVLLGGGLLGATLVFASRDLMPVDAWYAAAAPSRYGVLASLFLTPALVLAAGAVWQSRRGTRRALAGLGLGVLAFAVLADGRGDPDNTRGVTWSDEVGRGAAECRATGADAVTVLVTPTGLPVEWDAEVSCEWLTGSQSAAQ